MGKALDFIRSVFSRNNKPRKVYEQPANQQVLTIRRLSETEWEFEQIASALQEADNGNFQQLGQLTDAVLGDGTIIGQISVRYEGLLALPRYDEADDPKVKAALTKAFPRLAPNAILKLIAAEGDIVGFSVGEIIEPRPGVLTIIRHSAQYVQYRENENQWYLRTKGGGLEKINPGDGRWILYTPYGPHMPWRHGLWRALARNFILKEQALISLSAWNGSLATPAKVLEMPRGSTEEERTYATMQVDNWGFLPSYLLPEGAKLSLLQADQQSADSFKTMIEACDKGNILTVSGTSGMAEPGAGFHNSNVFQSVVATLIQSSGNALGQCVSEQLLPTWAATEFDSLTAYTANPTTRWDTTPPRDLKAQADAANMMGSALKLWKEAGYQPDLDAMAAQYGIVGIKKPSSK